MHWVRTTTFEQWREVARELLTRLIHPSEVHFDSEPRQPGLFDRVHEDAQSKKLSAHNFRTRSRPIRVPKQFLDIARVVACHRDADRFNLLYHILWRLTHDEPQLLEMIRDEDVRRLFRMEKSVKREMPILLPKASPEPQPIAELLADAPRRLVEMVRRQEGSARSAANYLPETLDYEALRSAAACCQGCHLHQAATQTVFGEGPISARLMLVGEQPGDQEDIDGKPFCGPAGQLLDQVLRQAGLERSQLYVTNAVKHFKYVPRGKRRLHKKPDSRELTACQPWLQAEVALVRPEVLVCLGASAAQSIVGPGVRLAEQRGRFQSTPWCDQTLITYHPSAALRAPDAARRDQIMQMLVADLTMAANQIQMAAAESV